MTISEKMQNLGDYTETEKTLIKFLLDNSQKMDKMSIQEVAKNTFSSNASIIRLCHKLGFEGYREFKLAFIRELESKKYLVNKVDYSMPFHAKESTTTIVNSIYSLQKESMDIMQSQLDIGALEDIVQEMAKAQRIFLFGISDVNTYLKSFMNKLLKIGLFPTLATDNMEQGNICPYVTENDCALFVSYSGSYESYLYCAKILKRNHVPILLLTANPNSPIYPYATKKICVPDLEKRNHIATFYSQQVFEYLLNLIYALLYRELYPKD